jgi:hypothetical protein
MGRIAVLGYNEPQIRAHFAAAFTTLPDHFLVDAFFSTLECLIREDTPQLVGVIEPLWMGKDLRDSFTELIEITSPRTTASSAALEMALNNPFAGHYLREAGSRQELQHREHTLSHSDEICRSSALLAVAVSVKDWKAVSQWWGGDPKALYTFVDSEDLEACAALLRSQPLLSSGFAQHLARNRSAHGDAFIEMLLARFDSRGRQVFFEEIVRDGQEFMHAFCANQTCTVHLQFEEAVKTTPSLAELVASIRPDWIPVSQLEPEDQIAFALGGGAKARDLRAYTVPQVFRGLRRQLAAEHGDYPQMAQRLAEELEPHQAEELLTRILGDGDTFAFGVGPFLTALAMQVPEEHRPSYVLGRTFQRGSLAYRKWGVPLEAETYLSLGESRAVTPKDRVDAATIEIQIAHPREVNRLLSDTLRDLPPEQARAFILHHLVTIAKTYQIPVQAALLATLYPPSIDSKVPYPIPVAGRGDQPMGSGHLAVISGHGHSPPPPDQMTVEPGGVPRRETRLIHWWWLAIAGAVAVLMLVMGIVIGRASAPDAGAPSAPALTPASPIPETDSTKRGQRTREPTLVPSTPFPTAAPSQPEAVPILPGLQ